MREIYQYVMLKMWHVGLPICVVSVACQRLLDKQKSIPESMCVDRGQMSLQIKGKIT